MENIKWACKINLLSKSPSSEFYTILISNMFDVHIKCVFVLKSGNIQQSDISRNKFSSLHH